MPPPNIFDDPYEDPDYSEPESDDSGVGPDPISPESESEDEPELGPDSTSIPNQPPSMPLGARAQKIWKILVFMDGQGITLANLLDGISWEDEECTQNAKIRVDRTQLLNSAELPAILRRWWKPPRSRSGKKKRPKGARAVMQNFAFDCSQQILEEEMEQLVKAFKSPAGDDVKEEHLTGISFPQMVARVKKIAPNLWVVLSRLARSQSQQERSPMKNPTNVSCVYYRF
ncbi:hypothetical protein B0H13DRAFT_2014863 [Mycena leptocephala]|nr:hypothetical protein B0H13DRAFT_2014863 [Mycena leptocephala]